MLATSKVVKRKIYRFTIDKIDHNGVWREANPPKGGGRWILESFNPHGGERGVVPRTGYDPGWPCGLQPGSIRRSTPQPPGPPDDAGRCSSAATRSPSRGRGKATVRSSVMPEFGGKRIRQTARWMDIGIVQPARRRTWGRTPYGVRPRVALRVTARLNQAIYAAAARAAG